MSAFQREILVRFGHCDAAGWVFYPRYFEMISDFVEDWFEDGLAASAPGLFHHKQILTPSVHFTVDFVKPTRYGDRLTFILWTTRRSARPPASCASRRPSRRRVAHAGQAGAGIYLGQHLALDADPAGADQPHASVRSGNRSRRSNTGTPQAQGAAEPA